MSTTLSELRALRRAQLCPLGISQREADTIAESEWKEQAGGGAEDFLLPSDDVSAEAADVVCLDEGPNESIGGLPVVEAPAHPPDQLARVAADDTGGHEPPRVLQCASGTGAAHPTALTESRAMA